jgi:hypothetical protein
MQNMSEFSTWEIASSAIMVLLGCAWHNWRTGYRKNVGSPGSDSEIASLLEISSVATPATLPFLVHGSAQAYTKQLISLNLALGTQPVGASTKSASISDGQ